MMTDPFFPLDFQVAILNYSLQFLLSGIKSEVNIDYLDVIQY